MDQLYSCNSRPARSQGWTLDGLTAGEGFGGKCNWTNPPPYRIHNAESTKQNTEYRIQNTESPQTLQVLPAHLRVDFRAFFGDIFGPFFGTRFIGTLLM